MNSFTYGTFSEKGMRHIIEEDFGIPIKMVTKIQIRKGKCRIYSSVSVEPIVKSLKVFEHVIWPICLSCDDFTCYSSDISVGSIGSENSANTVIVRTAAGEQIFNQFRKTGLIAAAELKDLSEINRIAAIKKKRKNGLSSHELTFLKKQTILGNWHRYLYKLNKKAGHCRN